jgi:hypothetical protein
VPGAFEILEKVDINDIKKYKLNIYFELLTNLFFVELLT